MSRSLSLLGVRGMEPGNVRVSLSGEQQGRAREGSSIWTTDPTDGIKERLHTLRRLEGEGAPDLEIKKAREQLRAGLDVVDVRDLTVPYTLYKKAQAAVAGIK